MELLFYLVLILVLLFFAGLMINLYSGLLRRRAATTGNARFRTRSPLAAEELALLRRLREAFPEVQLLRHVPFTDFLAVEGEERRAIDARRRQLEGERAPLLLVGRDGAPLAVVEPAGDGDPVTRRAAILKEAGLPHLRLTPPWPDMEGLRAMLTSAPDTPPADGAA